MLVTSIFSFSHNALYPTKEKNHHFSNNKNCRLQMLSIWLHLNFVVWWRVNPLPNNKTFHLSKLKAIADNKITVA